MPALRQRRHTVSAAANSTCPRCAAAFRCGMVGGDTPCWCASLPPVTPLPVPPAGTGTSCFCPACLAAIKAERAGKTPPR
ncbi:MAG: cysteine-rich CWC family protein [Rhodocyclales bacterium]|nr:cysteine-rich CWC family protein [Rhodocyclales bacterium]